MRLKPLLHLLALGVALLSMTATARAQGTVNFNNRIPPAPVAPIYGTNSGDPTLALFGNATTNGGSVNYTNHPLLAGPGYTCELWAGPLGTPDAALVLLSTVPFRVGSGSGFIVAPPAVAVAGVPAGALATVQVRAWDNKGGTISNWAGALADPTVARGACGSFTVGPLGTNAAAAALLTNMVSFNLHLPPASNSPPSITCPANITTNVLATSAVVNYPAPVVANGALAGCAPPSGSVFQLGTTPVTCTATNPFATVTCAFNVFVTNWGCPGLVASHSSTNIVVSWISSCGLQVLLEADDLAGPWTEAIGATSPYVVAALDTRRFYRLSDRSPPPPSTPDFDLPENSIIPVGATEVTELDLSPLPGRLTEEMALQIRLAAESDAMVRGLLGSRYHYISTVEVPPAKGEEAVPGAPLRTLATFYNQSSSYAVLAEMAGTNVVATTNRPDLLPPEGAEEVAEAVAAARQDPRIRDQVVGLIGNGVLQPIEDPGAPGFGHRAIYVTFEPFSKPRKD